VPVSTFSIALCIDGVPTVGVVYDPFMDRLYYAAKGNGAFCNDTKLQVSTQGMEHALIDVEGFPSTKPVIPVGSEITNVLVKKGALVQSLWAVILPACLLASGEYTGIIFNVPKPEDPAAVKVIIEEAGGKVTDLFGNDQRYDQPVKGFIASNGVIHDELVEIIKGVTT
jgi:myo-inositol-1(or 4)-monophosphatase